MILGVFRISGHSMFPSFSSNNLVFVTSLLRIRNNDVVVLNLNNKNLIKRIVRISKKKVFVTGDNRNDSFEIGWIEKKNILGKVVLKF